MNAKQTHWEHVYQTKLPNEVSWTQEYPSTSIKLIEELKLSKDAKIIDVGAGDSKLVDALLELGYQNITVLDISEKALERAKKRLGTTAKKVTWIHSDCIDFETDMVYDVWHDRAAFHFLTSETEKSSYVKLVHKHVSQHLILGTFSNEGPLKCSGLEIQQYSNETLTDCFSPWFIKNKCMHDTHQTPFGTAQEFVFCVFNKANSIEN